MSYGISSLVLAVACSTSLTKKFEMNLIFLLLLIFAVSCMSFPTGAPASQSVCDSMTPNHAGALPQESASPYQLVVSSNSIKSGEILTVEIQANDERSFKGFLLMARTNTENIVGEFMQDENELLPFNFRDCSGENHNAVTHSNNDLKNKISFKWRAPEISDGIVHFG